MYCPACKVIHKQGNFCDVCGATTIFSKFPCPHCDAPNYVTAKFCEHCGRPVQETAEAFVRQEQNKIEGGGE